MLTGWENFYVIVGSAAGALIGLQFVVLTLVAEKPSAGIATGVPAFGSPTIVHFSAVLLLSALTAVPWRTIYALPILWGVLGLSGVAYVMIVARRIGKQVGYEAQFEDWLFHVVLPMIAYFVLAFSWAPVSAPFPVEYFRIAFFGAGGATLLLLFVGIHNAWDSVSYHVVVHREKPHHENPPEREGA